MEDIIINFVGNEPLEIFSFGVCCGFFILLPLSLLLVYSLYEIIDLFTDWSEFKEFRRKKIKKSYKKM